MNYNRIVISKFGEPEIVKLVFLIFVLLSCKENQKSLSDIKDNNKLDVKLEQRKSKPSSQSVKDKNYYISSLDGLFLREEASIKSNKLTLIPYNEEIVGNYSEKVLDKVNNDEGYWIKAKYKDLEGWVFDKFIVEEFNSDCNIFSSSNFPKKFTNGCVGQCPKGTEDGTHLRVLFLSSEGTADVMVDVAHQFNERKKFGKWRKEENKIIIQGEIEYKLFDSCISSCKDSDLKCQECESNIKKDFGKKEAKLELVYELSYLKDNLNLQLMNIRDKNPLAGKKSSEILIEENWKSFVNSGYNVCIIPKLRVN